VGVLLKFRQNPVAVLADIKSFFHQIFVNEEDSAVFRFFWYEDELMENYAEHEMMVHTFGAKPSSCVSTFTLRFHGERMASQISEEVLRVLLESFYVDDYLDNFKSVAEVRKVRIELTETCGSSGFDLVK
jgi:hypothetical protein